MFSNVWYDHYQCETTVNTRHRWNRSYLVWQQQRGQNVIFVCGAQFTHHDLNPPCKISTTIHHTWYQIRSCERNLFVKSIWVSTHRHWHHHLVLCHFWRFKREYYTFFTFTSLVDLISGRSGYLSSLFFQKIVFSCPISKSKSIIYVFT